MTTPPWAYGLPTPETEPMKFTDTTAGGVIFGFTMIPVAFLVMAGGATAAVAGAVALAHAVAGWLS